MGRPKAELVLGGETMLARQLRLLRTVCRSVAVVGPSAGHPGLGVAVFPDELPGRGPLGGIYTGLQRSHTDFSLFVSCDLPYLEARFLHYLARRAVECQADVTVPQSPRSGFEPLCAIYRRRVLKVIRACLEAGENKTTAFFPHVFCCVISWPEIARAGFTSRIFANMNTRADYETARIKYEV